MQNPLINEDFLLQLEQSRNKEIFARIILLDLNELPIEQIEGKVTSGSINIDGTSSVRRSCSLSLISKDINVQEYHWGLKNKFKLEIGLTNLINTNYPDTIWFPQGIYVITSFSAALGINQYTINISGKDKMCLLNGDIAGSIMNISEDFGVKWYWQNDEHTEYISEDIPIQEIIYKGVQTYAGELPQNIIINDIAECGYKLMEYRGTTPMYLIKNADDGIYENMTINGEMTCYIHGTQITTLSALEDDGGNYETEIDLETNEGSKPTFVTFEKNGKDQYYIYPIQGGSGAIGYQLTDLTYAGELMASAGDAFTNILDKIVTMLGPFEYFYDLSGHFVFQKKKNYLTSKWTGLSTNNTDEENTTYAESNASNDTFSYIFDGNYFVINFTSTPNLANVRNDFSAWGTRTSTTGAEIPIHMRMAIDDKPWYYKTINGQIYYTEKGKSILQSIGISLDNLNGITEDWRELIYQMAKDYYNNNAKDDFFILIRKNNFLKSDPIENSIQLYPDGRTGYERYYTDMEAFWRQLYIPLAENTYFNNGIIAPASDNNLQVEVTNPSDMINKTFYIWDNSLNKCTAQKFATITDVKVPEEDEIYRRRTNEKANWIEYINANLTQPYYYKNIPIDDITITGPIVAYQNAPIHTDFTRFMKDEKNVPQKGYWEYDVQGGPFSLPTGDNSSTTYYTFNLKKLKSTTAIAQGRSYLCQEKNTNGTYNYYNFELSLLSEGQCYCTLNKTNGIWDADSEVNDFFYYTDYIDLLKVKKNVTETDLTLSVAQMQGIELQDAKGINLYDCNGVQLSGYDEQYTLLNENENKQIIKIQDCTYYELTGDVENDYLQVFTLWNYGVNNGYPKFAYVKIADELLTAMSSFELGNTYKIFIQSALLQECKNAENQAEWLEIQDFEWFKDELIAVLGDNTIYKMIEKNEMTYLQKINTMTAFPTRQNSADQWQKYNSETQNWEDFYIYYYTKTGENYYYFKTAVNGLTNSWNTAITTNPETLNFWIDFIDPEANGLEKYSVKQIGPRPKVVNEDSINSIYYREIPNVLFETDESSAEYSHQTGYTYIKLNDSLANLFVMSGQGVSAKDKIEEMLNDYTFSAEQVQISGVPIYRLDANTRISVKDKNTGISGEYVISRISIPLGHNGTMSITASKAAELIY